MSKHENKVAELIHVRADRDASTAARNFQERLCRELGANLFCHVTQSIEERLKERNIELRKGHVEAVLDSLSSIVYDRQYKIAEGNNLNNLRDVLGFMEREVDNA